MTAYLLPEVPVRSVDEHLASAWGGKGLERAVALGPEATIEELRSSGLRGRGGGGFPTGTKWASVRSQPGTHHYAVANGAEGEPGTFKDRALMRANPYLVVEGLVIAAYAVGADEAFLAVKASFVEEADRLTDAVAEMQRAGVCSDCTVTIVRGPDEYLFGEEKGLLEVIEGKPPMPRLLPPHEHGLFATAPQTGWQATEPEPGHTGRHESNPTLVNNVETLANAAVILARGADWYRTMGSERSPGHVIATVVGDVVRPGVGEVELGTPVGEVIDAVAGGARPGRAIKAVFSGVANAVLLPELLDTPLTYEDLAAAGSGMGAAGFIVYDDTTCMVEVAHLFSRFLSVESCGQCPACKLGSGEITTALAQIEAGTTTNRTADQLTTWLTKVTDANRCYLGREEQLVVSSILTSFAEEVEEHGRAGGCDRHRGLLVPKLVDLVDGVATYDERSARKQPDWTYS
jgi:NADH:ubiquinone oxidoreductase subunit F (NADH-binding)